MPSFNCLETRPASAMLDEVFKDAHESFHKELLKGVNAAEVLSCAGRHFAAAPHAKSARIVSHHVEILDGFLSYSRQAGRWRSFSALILHFNGPAAALFGYLAAFATFPLAGALPMWTRWSTTVNATLGGTMLCSLCGSLVALAVLVYGQRLRELVGLRPRMLFLDRLCTDQSDPEKKFASIQALGAVVAYSMTMIAVMDDTYWERLWCVFEVAAFARVGGGTRFNFLSADLSSITLNMWFALFLVSFIRFALDISFWPVKKSHHMFWMLLHPVIGSCAIFLFCRLARQYVLASRQLERSLMQFSMPNAGCSDEDERKLICAKVEGWFGSVEEFEFYVQHDVRAILRSGVIDRSRLGFWWTLLLGLPMTCFILDMCAGYPTAGEGTSWVLIASRFLYLMAAGPCGAAFWTTMCLLYVRVFAERFLAKGRLGKAAFDLVGVIVGVSCWLLPWMGSPTYGSWRGGNSNQSGFQVYELILNVFICFVCWLVWWAMPRVAYSHQLKLMGTVRSMEMVNLGSYP